MDQLDEKAHIHVGILYGLIFVLFVGLIWTNWDKIKSKIWPEKNRMENNIDISAFEPSTA